MNKSSFYAGLLIVCLSLSNANAQERSLSVFDPLVNSTWQANGQWGDGSAFKQQIHFRESLNGKVIIADSKGFTNKEQTNYGNRNHGIRWYDQEGGKLRFWEFDVFGGLTQGEVSSQAKNIIYTYNYGGTEVTDMWEFVNDSTYNFKVGSYSNGQWQQVYLNTQFHKMEQALTVASFGKKLAGKWSSKAWDGQLDESWEIDQTNQLAQHAKYVENGEVQYQASSKIEKVGDQFIIFSVIKDNNPKIFKASFVSADRIVFENSEYEYPNKVVYDFNKDGTYNRTISGIQDGKMNSYTFEFKRVE